MKILYDYQIFNSQEFGGVSRYFSELAGNIGQHHSVEISTRYTNNVHLLQNKSIEVEKIRDHREEFIKGIEFKGKTRIFRSYKKLFPSKFADQYQLNKLKSIELLKQQNFDIFHPTYYDDYFLEFIGNKPFVLTIYDMIHEIFPELFSVNNQVLINKKKLAVKADHIIAISENTKKDIINIFGIEPSKISVTHLAEDLSSVTINEKPSIPENYILFVGARKGYKNFLFFIHAIAETLIEKDIKLVCTGDYFSAEEKELLKQLKIENLVVHFFANESSLKLLYQQAAVFVFPSYYEGFGIPILEAFANNCPVALAGSSCFQEIAGDAALYYDPKNKNEIVGKIKLILEDDILRTQMVKKGEERLKLYSWKTTSDKTMSVYEKVTSKSK